MGLVGNRGLVVVFSIGGGERGRNRTYNLVIKSHLLCQLSYAPAFEVGWKLAQIKLRQEPIIPSRD